MRDGRTRKLEVMEPHDDFEAFAARWRAAVIVLSGGIEGTEYEIDRPSVSLGRGDEATWKFPDDTMSKEHAALEVTGERIRLRDLGSMNGIKLNGAETKAADLKNGDRFQLGKLVFQLVIEERRREPRTYVLED
jgi:pSer/pThr/pTyr-binding forkhead associated (FHA) protein